MSTAQDGNAVIQIKFATKVMRITVTGVGHVIGLAIITCLALLIALYIYGGSSCAVQHYWYNGHGPRVGLSGDAIPVRTTYSRAPTEMP